MKYKILFLIHLLSSQALAVVQMDKQLPLGPGLVVFASQDIPHLVYSFPAGIHRISEPVYTVQGKRIIARFDIGVPDRVFQSTDLTVKSLAGANMSLRRFVAMDTQFDNSAMELDQKWKPTVRFVGDTKDLYGPITVQVEIDRGKGLSKKSGEKYLKNIFSKNSDVVLGTLNYTFNASANGNQYQAHSAVMISLLKDTSAGPQILSLAKPRPQLSSEVKILYDEASGCWENPTPGVVCLKK